MKVYLKSIQSRFVFVSLIILAFVFSTMGGCDYPPPKVTETPSPTYTPEPTQTPLPVPEKPIVDQSGGFSVDAGSQIPIRADSDGAVEYQWKLQGIGEISANTGPAIFYIAPEFEGGDAVVTVTAYNSQGRASPETALIIKVNPAPVTLTKLEITSPLPGVMLTSGKEIDCNGTYELSYGMDTRGIYVWVLLGDKKENYYLQNPPVSFKNDGNWETTIRPGKNLNKIIAVQVTNDGNDFFKEKVKNNEWDAFTELPEGSYKIYEIDIQS